MKKHFKRTVKSWVVGVLLGLAGVIFICMTPTPPTQIDPPWLRLAFAIAFVIILAITANYAFCFGEPDYDFTIEYNLPYVIFRMSENEVLVFVSKDMKTKRNGKDKRYIVVSDDEQSALIPYNPEIWAFLNRPS